MSHIALFSDLHQEFGAEPPVVMPGAEVIILAGDIHKGLKTLVTARDYQQQTGLPVIVVAGNHEFYGADHPTLLGQLRQEAAALESVHFLENDVVVIGDTRYLGCTLWTDFSLYGSRQRKKMMQEAQSAINDFRLISINGRAFQPTDALALFEASYRWLEAELAKPFAGKTVVVTHFAPHRAAIHSRYGDGDHITPYFVPDCTALFDRYNIDAWFYGHTHNSIDTVVANGTRLISNQGGYPREYWEYVRFDPDKLIEI